MKKTIFRRVLIWALWIMCFVACFFLASVMAGLTIKFLQTIGIAWSVQDTLGALSMRILVYVLFVFLVLTIPFVMMRQPANHTMVGLGRWMTFRDIGLALAGLVIYGLLTLVTQFILTNTIGYQSDQTQDLGISTRLFGMNLLYAYMVLVFVTPFLEELLFRGVLYGQLRSHHMSAWLTSLIVSLLFGLAHGQWNVGVDVFCLSLVACYLREATGTIWPGVMMHVVKNGVAFYLIFILPQLVSS